MAISTIPSIPKHLRLKNLFGVEINGFISAYFTKIDRPKVEHEEVAFAGAGSHRDEKLPGRQSFPDITAEKGVAAFGTDDEVLNWLKEQTDFISGVGSAPAGMLRDIAIVEYNREHAEVARWSLIGAWVKSFDGGELDGSASENVIDSITFCYQHLE